jgi:hypothetical protein
MKDRKVKQVLFGEGYQSERARENGDGEGFQIWWMYFVYMYEN